MPVAKLNFTGRVRIRHRDAVVNLVEAGGQGAYRFDADLNLAEYNFPGTALVFVEAYRKTEFDRFPFGTVDNLTPPAGDKRGLSGFSSPHAMFFRVKITDRENGKVFGEADRIRPEGGEEAGRESMLPVDPVQLGQECWRLNFAPAPVFEINRKMPPTWRDAARSPQFCGLIYPAVLREILTRILLVEKYSETEDDDWMSLWLRFAGEKLRAGKPPEPGDGDENRDEIEDWIGVAVTNFSRRVRAFSKLPGGLSDD